MKTSQIRSPSHSINTSSSTWFERFKRQGFYFQHVAIATILGGLYLHISRVFLGDDLLIQYVFTPLFDKVLTIPMFYAGVTGLLIRNRIQFLNTRHKIVYGLSMFPAHRIRKPSA